MRNFTLQAIVASLLLFLASGVNPSTPNPGIVPDIVLASQNQAPASIGKTLTYTDAQTIAEVKSSEGTLLHLRTRDSFDKVVKWYVANLKPTKRMKVSENSVLLKVGSIMAVIATDGKETDVVIKQFANQ